MVSFGPAQPFNRDVDIAGQGPFAVSDAAPGVARDLVNVLQSHGAQAAVLGEAFHDIRTVILTEGLSDLPVTERHWKALYQCRKFYGSDVRIIMLEPSAAVPVDQLSGLAGLSRTLRQEWPGHDVVTWSLPGNGTPAEWAKLVGSAFSSNLSDATLTLRGTTTQQIGLAPRVGQVSHEASNVWFVPGGARGVTAACVKELSRRQPDSTFVLAGRSAVASWPAGIAVTKDMKQLRGALISSARESGQKPSLPDIDRQAKALLAGQEIRETLDEIAAAGAKATYLQADMSDMASIQSVVATVSERYGAITGLIHGAGVLADGLALKKSREDVAYVFGPKVEGLAMLLKVIDLTKLRHVGLFSSASAVFGNVGQSDYAMANSWLGAVARKLSAELPGAIVKSFCWGPWAGGMVDSSLAGHFASRGISLIGLDDGARIFADQILRGERSEVELLIGDEWAG